MKEGAFRPSQESKLHLFPTVKPFSAIVDNMVVDDLVPFCAAGKKRSIIALYCGVDSASQRANRHVELQLPSYNVLLPLIFPHVVRTCSEISEESIGDTLSGIRHFLRGDVPERGEVSHAVFHAYDFAGRVAGTLDPRLIDAVARHSFEHGLPVDWQELRRHVAQLEFPQMAFIESIAN